MISKHALQLAVMGPLLALARQAGAVTYYVSPTGSDSNSGTSSGAAWQSLAKVDSTTFAPGSQILFQDGGNWYGSQLVASSDGTPSQPIVYGSYGNGANPTFWGSVPVSTSSLLYVGGTTYFYPSTTPVTAFLLNHQFFHNADITSGQTSASGIENYVTNTPNSAYYVSAGANSGELFNTGFEPLYNNASNAYSAVVQDDVISSNAHNNLVFQDFNVRESASEGAGYGIRVQNSTNVQVLNSTITAAGKHAVGVIDSTQFLGENLTASYLLPDQQYGGATGFVSYADFNVSQTTSQWINDSFSNPNGPYQAIITHIVSSDQTPTPIASVLIKNLTANTDPAITVITSGTEKVTITGGTASGDVQIEGNNTTINGLLVTGNSMTSLQGNNNTIENSIISNDTPNWTASRDGAILVQGNNNTIRYNSIHLNASSGIYGAAFALENGSSNTQIYGNAVDTPYAAFYQPSAYVPSLTAYDNLFAGAAVPYVIYYNRTPADVPLTSWPAGVSSNELYSTGAAFADPEDNDLDLQPGSIASYVFNPATSQYVMYDYYGNVRPTVLDSLGAIQVPESGTAGNMWTTDADGDFSNAANWSNGVVPNATDAVAILQPSISAPRTVTVSSNVTLGVLYFSSPFTYTVAGTGTISFNSSSGASAIDVSAGNHTISAPMNLSNPTAVNIAATSVLTLSGAVTGTGSLTANGGGTLLIAANASIGVPLVANGSLVFAAHGNSGGILVQTVGSLTITPLGLAGLADPGAGNHSNRTLLVTGDLTFSSTTSGTLDLNSNDLIVENGNLAQITAAIASGYNLAGGGTWNGPAGIISSAAAADTTHLTAIGVILNSPTGSGPGRLYGGSGPLGTFDGTSPASTDVLVKYTYFGDANLDGKVDGSDYSRIDAGVLTGATGWYNGDFNYDGTIDGSDYTLLDNAFNTQAAELSAEIGTTAQITSQIAATSPVPEPGSALLIGIVTARLLGRRRASFSLRCN